MNTIDVRKGGKGGGGGGGGGGEAHEIRTLQCAFKHVLLKPFHNK